jgi:acyl dehydratase
MALEVARALAAEFEPVVWDWGPDDVIRYHLGLGAGAPRCEGAELRYVFEDVLQVLPTFAVIPASSASSVAAHAPGLDYDDATVIHGEHQIEIFAPCPVSGRSVNRARVEAVYDRGVSAVLVVTVDTELLDGTALARNRFRLLLPGQGGFGGTPPPRMTAPDLTNPPDSVFTVATLPQQNALYRMTGDRTRVHIDPALARAAGFPQPTLPGLCTWGLVAKAIVDGELAGDVDRMTGWAARFAGPVYPGETLQVSLWRRPGEMLVNATVLERQAPALSMGRFAYAEG